MLFNNDSYYEILENFNVLDLNSSRNDFFNIEDGLQRGNLFKDLYSPYKNYVVKRIKTDNEKDKMLLKIYELDFAINDLNLYLDMHPNDKDALRLFAKYNKELVEYSKEYSKKYEPLCLEDVSNNEFNWLDNPWPWDKMGGIHYV